MTTHTVFCRSSTRPLALVAIRSASSLLPFPPAASVINGWRQVGSAAVLLDRAADELVIQVYDLGQLHLYGVYVYAACMSVMNREVSTLHDASICRVLPCS